MANIGVVPTGRTWPGTLEVSRLDAYAGAFKLDSSLPVIGTDPVYPANKVVIGRGRLVGIVADATVSATTITTTIAHNSVLTVADGVNVAPLGYATANVIKDFDSKLGYTMAAINRNQAIAVPYLAAINGLYGALNQGDKVTALYSTDPRTKGAICKYIPYKVYSQNGPVGAIQLSGSMTYVPNVQTNFEPTILAGYTQAGTFVTGTAAASIIYSSGFRASGATVISVVYGYGQSPEMCAGEVLEMEGLSDMPGFLKWVKSNFGEWSLGYGLAYPLVGNSTSTTVTATYLSTGVLAIATDTANAVYPTRMDPTKAITITLNSGTSGYLFNGDTGVWDDKGVSYELPAANFVGADETQGACYMVDPINGIIRLFGIGSDSSGTAFTGAAGAAAPFVISYYELPKQEQPDYDSGVYGLNDGTNTGAPLEWTRDPVTLAASVGIMKVAIH